MQWAYSVPHPVIVHWVPEEGQMFGSYRNQAYRPHPESGKPYERGMVGIIDHLQGQEAGWPLRQPPGQAVGSTELCLWDMGVSEEGRCLLSRIIGKGALGTAWPSLESHKYWWPQSLAPSTKLAVPWGKNPGT